MRRASFAVMLVVAFVATEAHAAAKGEYLSAPNSVEFADCEPGSKPPSGGGEVFVLGCAVLPDSDPVLIGGSRSFVHSCVYVAPPGADDMGLCDQVASAQREFGGQLTTERRALSPLTGGESVTMLRVGRYRDGTFASGVAPGATRKVILTSDGIQVHAGLLDVPLASASKIGATHGYTAFAARLPDDLDICAGVRVVAKRPEARVSGRYTGDWNPTHPAPPAPLPGTRDCAADGAWTVARSASVVGKAVRFRARGV